MKDELDMVKDQRLPLGGLLNLIVLYIVWGSTYLAIRVAVGGGTGFHPFTLAASRVFVAGTILMVIGVLQHQRLRPERRELVTLVLSAILLWLGGNGLLSWSEQRMASGLAALIVGSTPIIVALMEAIIDRQQPTLFLIVSLFLGFLGISLLSFPVLRSGIRADVISVLTLLLASISWGAGSLLQSRRPLHLSPSVSSGYQHLFGGIFLASAALITREPFSVPSMNAWIAWGYLVIFGSVVAFTSFLRALRSLPTNVVMTYSYVNPVIAVFLGWIILGESITIWTVLGTALILVGVSGVFMSRTRKIPV